jgi:UDP-glucuronate decarboxylase
MARATDVIREDAAIAVSQMGTSLESLKGTTLLVTGAGGFLCSYFLDIVKALNDSGSKACRVIAVDNYKTGLPERLRHLEGDANFRFITADVTEPLDLDERPDWIIHGAGIASPVFYRRFPLETIDVNVTGTRLMLDLARASSVKGMVILSSSEIYGNPVPEAIPTGETYLGNVSCTGPRACYDESKRLGETLAVTYHRLYGVPVRMIRPFNVYGPGQRLDDKRIMPDILAGVLARRPLVLYSDGKATRSFCYVRDAAAGMLHVLIEGESGEAYNVGNDVETSIGELAETAAASADGDKLAVEYELSADGDYLADNPQRRCPDLSKVKARTGWGPKVSLGDGLKRTLRSYREDGAGGTDAGA